jgi:hypothetical protein
MEDVIFELDEDTCPCRGLGWAECGRDWVECPIHFEGQLHPESKQLLLDDLRQLREEERKSILKWKIEQSRKRIAEAQHALRAEQAALVKLELELINRTPTVKMPAVASSLLNPATVMVIHEDVHEDLVFHSIASGE